MQRHPGAGDGGRAGPAVGLNDVAIDHDLPLAHGLQVDNGAKASTDQALDLLGATGGPARRRLPLRARRGGARQHRIFGRHPTPALPPQPRRRLVFERSRTKHMRIAEFDQAGALGIPSDAALDRDGSQRVGGAVGGTHGVLRQERAPFWPAPNRSKRVA